MLVDVKRAIAAPLFLLKPNFAAKSYLHNRPFCSLKVVEQFSPDFAALKVSHFLSILQRCIPTFPHHYHKRSYNWILINFHLLFTFFKAVLKVSKFQRQIILSSHCPKKQRNFSHFSALASKKSWKIVQNTRWKHKSTNLMLFNPMKFFYCLD